MSKIALLIIFGLIIHAFINGHPEAASLQATLKDALHETEKPVNIHQSDFKAEKSLRHFFTSSVSKKVANVEKNINKNIVRSLYDKYSIAPAAVRHIQASAAQFPMGYGNVAQSPAVPQGQALLPGPNGELTLASSGAQSQSFTAPNGMIGNSATSFSSSQGGGLGGRSGSMSSATSSSGSGGSFSAAQSTSTGGVGLGMGGMGMIPLSQSRSQASSMSGPQGTIAQSAAQSQGFLSMQNYKKEKVLRNNNIQLIENDKKMLVNSKQQENLIKNKKTDLNIISKSSTTGQKEFFFPPSDDGDDGGGSAESTEAPPENRTFQEIFDTIMRWINPQSGRRNRRPRPEPTTPSTTTTTGAAEASTEAAANPSDGGDAQPPTEETPSADAPAADEPAEAK